MITRRTIASAAAAVLLAGPAALALARGGYFDEARLWAAVGVWVLVAVAAVIAPHPLPRTASAIAALAGLGGLLAWTLISFGWTPLRAPAVDDAQRAALYLGALLAATALLRGRVAPLVVPALAAGIVITTLYGLSERLLPTVFELARSPAALGRLNQPLTYWNAMGAWAAIGVVLCARLAGEHGRPVAVRMTAAACAAPLGAAIALSLSRGAIAAALIGCGVLALLDTQRSARRPLAVAAAAALAAGATAVALPAVRTLEGARTSQGLLLLAVLAAVMAIAAVAVRRDRATARPSARPARGPLVAVGVVAVLVLVASAAALEGRPESDTAGATATRLSSAASNRYAYWEVALRQFADAPFRGHGAGSFGVDWLRERDVDEVVRDAHSLELETAAELGLAGLALLGLLVGGVVAAAVSARRRAAAAVAGPIAALSVWAAHGALDWDWEMPALTLVAVLLAGLVLGLADEPRAARRMALGRAALALVSVSIAAGLAAELRSAQLVSAARQSTARGDLQRDLDRLERAERLSVDRSTPQLDQAKLLVLARRDREASAVASRLVEREPENALAWGLVGLANKRLDPTRSRAALREQQRLIGRP